MPDTTEVLPEDDSSLPIHERFFTKGMLITLGIMVIFFLLAAGYLLYENASSEKQQEIRTFITRISPTPSVAPTVITPPPTPTIVPIWNTYSNASDHYTISYLRDWNIRHCPEDETCSKTDNAIYFESKERIGSGSEFLAYTVWVQHWLNPEHKSFKDLVGGGLDLRLQKDFHYQTETVAGVNRIRTTSLPVPFGAEFVFFPENDGSFLSVAITPYSTDNPFEKQDQYLQTFENMVSSFQITN